MLFSRSFHSLEKIFTSQEWVGALARGGFGLGRGRGRSRVGPRVVLSAAAAAAAAAHGRLGHVVEEGVEVAAAVAAAGVVVGGGPKSRGAEVCKV